ncbi:toxin co-regulated pilus biosynthesis Q family protein [Alcaligenaceae bacterium C4P045]|nr:toxin co-regulated pilus biosynthesis Q family protein [Alcaligenaceae bacterium C4P045]
MHAPFLAAAFAAACLLSACGFVPPAPPTPGDGPRVAINRSDPRKTDMHAALVTTSPSATATAMATASDPKPSEPVQTGIAIAEAAIPVPAAPPASPNLTSAATDTVPTNTASALEPVKTTGVVLTTSNVLPTLPSARELAPASGESGPTATPGETPEPVVPKPIWHIQPEDGTVRQAIARWASRAGWTFGPDQWESNFDLPIQAPAQFDADSFQEATQALSKAIAMTESPVRPCFYANRVLRVVPITRSCNRAAPPMPSP